LEPWPSVDVYEKFHGNRPRGTPQSGEGLNARGVARYSEVGSMGVGAGLYMYDVLVKKFAFAISSPDEFLS